MLIANLMQVICLDFSTLQPFNLPKWQERSPLESNENHLQQIWYLLLTIEYRLPTKESLSHTKLCLLFLSFATTKYLISWFNNPPSCCMRLLCNCSTIVSAPALYSHIKYLFGTVVVAFVLLKQQSLP